MLAAAFMRFQPPLLSAALLALTFGVAGCGSADDPAEVGDEQDVTQAKICTEHHIGTTADGDAVAICDKTFDARPFVRPPKDTLHTDTASTLYVGVDIGMFYMFVDRHNTEYVALDKDGKPYNQAHPLTQLHMPSNRNLFMLYKVKGMITEFTDPDSNEKLPAIKMTSVAPAILLEGKAIDGVMLRAWEGTVSQRTGDAKFDSTTRVPMRLSFSSLMQLSNLSVWNPGTTLKDGERYVAMGTVENFNQSVLGSDGTCLPSFSSLGSANPWLGATDPSVTFQRIAGMHFPGDQVNVLSYPKGTTGLTANGMGGLRVMHPGGLIQVDAQDEWNDIHIFPHAAPNGNTVELHPVTGGGGACK